MTCPQGRFITSGNYAACCDKAKCPIPTACNNNKMSYDNFAVNACGESASCQTMSIRSAPGDTGDVTTSLLCAQYWYALEVYRDTVPVTTVSPTKTSTSASAGSTPTSTSASMTTSPSATTGAASSSGASSSPSSAADGSSGGSTSKAWIAGAVVGPLAGLALIGVGLWLFRRNSQKKKRNEPNVPEIGGYERSGDEWHNKQYYGDSHPKHESTTAGYYAPPEQHVVHEMPGNERRA